MDLREEYKKNNGEFLSVVCSDIDGNTYYTDEYTEWLEEKKAKSNNLFKLYRIEIDGNGLRDNYIDIAVSTNRDTLVEYVKEKYGVGIGKDNGFKNFWDGYFIIEESKLKLI